MIEKLEEIHSRYLDIEEKLSDPTVASDMKQFTKLNKEYSSLREINQAYLSYRDILDNMDSSKAMLNDSDQEMRDMAKEELASLEESKKDLDEKLKILLIPKDP
ncbi:MAG: PCRF domain-containing protein, partial [Saprospiraceae bacterium]|nr:PCRF domain-containing protein [Saprospiraceae bacterium]